MKENVSPLHINMHLELRSLSGTDWLVKSGTTYTLTPKSLKLISDLEAYFRVSKKKTEVEILGVDHKEKIAQYLQLFPKIKLPSGKLARSDEKSIADAFKWFFSNYDYEWDIIMQATADYVDEYELKRYMYMQNSQYFIRKQQPDKTWSSELANYCAHIRSGGANEGPKHFSENVV